MATKLYVGNIPWRATEETLAEYFGQVGEVQSVNIITDRQTGRSRGFCFVEMENGKEAIEKLNDIEFEGRNLRVSEAKQRESR
jgi:RNA recognition motif-containing protein